MEDCPKPTVIEKEESPTSQSSGSLDQQKRLRKSSWDNSDEDLHFAEKENDHEKTGRIYSADKSKNSDAEIQQLKEVYLQSRENSNEEENNLEISFELSDRRHSPARIRRRRRSSSGSSIVSENALDDRISQVAKTVIDEKVEEALNVRCLDSITNENASVTKTLEKDMDKENSRTTTPKKLPPLENSSRKENFLANSEILHEVSKNISNMIFKKTVNPNELKTKHKKSCAEKYTGNVRAKSNELEKRSKNLEKKHGSSRPKSEKMSGSKSNIEMAKQEYPKPGSPIVLTEEKSNSEINIEISYNTVKEIQEKNLPYEVEFETRNIRKSSERPKSANFLIMEDLENVDMNESCKDSGRKADRLESAGSKSNSTSRSSYPFYFEINKGSEDSLGKSLSSDQSTSGSKISDIHSWSGRDIKISPETDFDSEKWRHNFEELYRTGKNPYSEREQLTSSDSTEKSGNSECNIWKESGKMHQNEIELIENKKVYFSLTPQQSFGIGDSKEIQCWNVEKSEVKNIEEPQDHGDGNFKVNWDRLMSQPNEKKRRKCNQEMKKQFWSEMQEMLDNTDKRSWLSDIEEENSRNFSEELHSPKIAKSKWSLVNSGIEITKPMSSSLDASVQCNIILEQETKRPRKRKRERGQNANENFKTENVVVYSPSVGAEKKETIINYDEIKSCEKEALEDQREFLILKRCEEKQITNFKNFLAKSNCDFSAGKLPKNNLESKSSIKSALKLWKNKNKKSSNLGKLSFDKDSHDPFYMEPFYGCNCLRIFYRSLKDFFGVSR